eukprot:scaffold28860_cov90-Isochrysis_galbana.AAC.1
MRQGSATHLPEQLCHLRALMQQQRATQRGRVAPARVAAESRGRVVLLTGAGGGLDSLPQLLSLRRAGWPAVVYNTHVRLAPAPERATHV